MLEGTTVVITGATSGIGKSLATTVHGLGATVIALGRSESKLSGLRQELLSLDDGDNRIMTVVADLSDLDSVSNAADTIKLKLKKIDFLINNAGIHYQGDVYRPSSQLQSKQGFDLAFAVNYLSHFLLTAKLRPLLEKSDLNQTRIIQISSNYHWLVDGTDLMPQPHEDTSSPIASRADKDIQTYLHKNRSYANSKMAQIYHMRALSRRRLLQNTKIRIVSVCPGWVATHIGGQMTRRLEYLGSFPADGIGIQSALNAMFLPGLGEEDKDFVTQFYANADYFPREGSDLARWVNKWVIRDVIINTAAQILVLAQRFFFQPRVVMRSSLESYNVETQEKLYEWSEHVIQPWL